MVYLKHKIERLTVNRTQNAFGNLTKCSDSQTITKLVSTTLNKT